VILNHLRLRVAEHLTGEESYCPLCRGPLIAKRGDLVIHHWAHKPSAAVKSACPFEESPWHLGCKDAYSRFTGWEIEYPVTIDGERFVLDAFNPTTGRVREFIHTLSPYYLAKHRRLAAQYSDVRWLFDGAEFASARRSLTRDRQGYRDVLKPRALIVAEGLMPRVGVLFTDAMLKHWRGNVWYKVRSDRARDLVKLLNASTAARRKQRMESAA
jgi:hypothetical protein